MPFRLAAGGLTVAVRLTPKARAQALGGLQPDADGGVLLKAAVTAAPEKGKANAALVALLAAAWDLPKSKMEIIAGETSRTKTLLIQGDGPALMTRLTAWLDQA